MKGEQHCSFRLQGKGTCKKTFWVDEIQRQGMEERYYRSIWIATRLGLRSGTLEVSAIAKHVSSRGQERVRKVTRDSRCSLSCERFISGQDLPVAARCIVHIAA